MSNKFRENLEKRIQDEALERGSSFIESRNDSIHEVGINRGYIMALRDVLTWSTQIEGKLNS